MDLEVLVTILCQLHLSLSATRRKRLDISRLNRYPNSNQTFQAEFNELTDRTAPKSLRVRQPLTTSSSERQIKYSSPRRTTRTRRVPRDPNSGLTSGANIRIFAIQRFEYLRLNHRFDSTSLWRAMTRHRIFEYSNFIESKCRSLTSSKDSHDSKRNEPRQSPDKVEANAECGCTKYGRLSPLQCYTLAQRHENP